MNYVQSALLLEEDVFELEISHFHHWENVYMMTNNFIQQTLVGKKIDGKSIGLSNGSIKSINNKNEAEVWIFDKDNNLHVRNYSIDFLLKHSLIVELSTFEEAKIQKNKNDLFLGFYNLVKNEVLYHNMWKGNIVKTKIEDSMVEVLFLNLKTNKKEIRTTNLYHFANLIKKQLINKQNNVFDYLDAEEKKVLDSHYHLCKNVLKIEKDEKIKEKMYVMAKRTGLSSKKVDQYLS